MALKLARDGVVQLSANLSRAGISFVSLAWFANVVPREELAILFLYQAVLGLASIPASYGLNGAIIKRITENHSKNQIISAGGILTAIGLIVVSTSLLAGQSFVNQYFGRNLLIWVLIGLVFAEFKKYLVAILRGTGHIPASAFIEFTQTAIWASSAMVLITLGGDPVVLIKTLVGSFVVSTVVGVLSVISLVKPAFVVPDFESIKSLLSYAKHNVIAHVDSYSYQWVDIAILGVFATQSNISGYEIAWRLTATLVIISRAIESPLFPILSRYYSNREHGKFSDAYKSSLLAITGVVIPGIIGIFILGSQILELVFGGYQDVLAVLFVLLLVRVIESIDRVLKTVLSAVDRPDLRARAVLASLVLNITLNILLIYTLGVIGAAIATTLSFSVSTMLLIYYINITDAKTYLPNQIIPPSFIWIIISAICMAGAVFAVESIIDIDALFELLVVIILGGGVYLASVLLNPRLRKVLLERVLY